MLKMYKIIGTLYKPLITDKIYYEKIILSLLVHNYYVAKISLVDNSYNNEKVFSDSVNGNKHQRQLISR